MRTGTARLPLHGGRAPRWLTLRMARLAREIVVLIAAEAGPGEVLRRLSDPFWFQAFGCALGFDWHSSGVTTTVCGALREALDEAGREIGLFACGGKGGRSRHTPDEVRAFCHRTGQDAEPLVYASRMAAKIDNAALQDGYRLYHHSFFFDRDGGWCVVQQGMADESDPLGLPHRGFARRYHWLGSCIKRWDCEPHAAICAERTGQLTLNLVARESESARAASVEAVRRPPDRLLGDLRRLPELRLDARHAILGRDIRPDRLATILLRTYEAGPASFLDLLGLRGVGPRTLRALALVSELVYGAPPSYRDPARFSFAHGGKDGIPFPVDRDTYARTIETLREEVNASRAGREEKRQAFRRLSRFAQSAAAQSRGAGEAGDPPRRPTADEFDASDVQQAGEKGDEEKQTGPADGHRPVGQRTAVEPPPEQLGGQGGRRQRQA